MTLLIYAIAECEPAEVEGIGLDGARLEAVSEGKLSTVVSDEVQSDQPPSVERLWRYERVIEGLMERHPILPVRYGSRSEDRHEVSSFLRERYDALAAALDRVGSAVELSIHARWRAMERFASPQSGTDYMRRRLEDHRRVAALSGWLEPLSSFARASQIRALSRPPAGVQGAYLVAPDRVGEFTERVSQLAGSGDVDLVCTGPWPPYTFVEAASR